MIQPYLTPSLGFKSFLWVVVELANPNIIKGLKTLGVVPPPNLHH